MECASGSSSGPTPATSRRAERAEARGRASPRGEQNLIVPTYATTDGERYFRKERALTSFTGPARTTTAAVEAEPDNLGTVDDPDTREQYAAEARRMAAAHDPDDPI